MFYDADFKKKDRGRNIVLCLFILLNTSSITAAEGEIKRYH